MERGQRFGEPLNPRERECLWLLTEGLSSKQIGEMLDLEPMTVDGYIKTARVKLGARNRTHAAVKMVCGEAG